MEEDDKNFSRIRQKTRCSNQIQRTKKRSEIRAAHRFNLEKIADEVQIPNLDEVYRLSVHLRKEKSLQVLHRLRMGLSVGSESTKVFLNAEGAIYSLVGCFTGPNADMQREALNVFINLGLGTSEQCLKVYNAVGVYLVLRMNSKLAEAKDASAWCIGNMCVNNKEVCHEMRKCGMDIQLYELLKSPVPRVFQSACFALTHFYATVPELAEAENIHEIVKNTMDGMEKFPETIAEAAWFLTILSSNKSVCKYMLSQGIISLIMCNLEKVINQQNLDISRATSLLRVLLNCIGAFPSQAIKVCRRSEQFVAISKALLYSPNFHLRTEALQFVANVINGACMHDDGLLLVGELGLRQRLDAALRSTLAANFSLKSPSMNDCDSLEYQTTSNIKVM